MNPQYAALVAVSDKMVSSLSADPLSVAQMMFAKGLIPQATLQSLGVVSKTKTEAAAELVQLVLSLVKDFPENFDEFMDVVDKHLWLKNLAKLIRETLSQNQQQQVLHHFNQFL